MAKAATGRVALVTGGASGIGLATAKRLLEAGWKVAAVDRDEKLLASVARELSQPKRVFTSVLDVTDEAAAEKVVAMSAEALGGLDGVVFNVGIGVGEPWLSGTTVDDWDRVFAGNLRGAMLTLKAAMPVMADGGSIVLISSIASMKPGISL